MPLPNHIQSLDQTHLAYDYDQCCLSLTITQLTTDGQPACSVHIEEIWPESVRERAYGQNLSNTLSRFTVSFSFKKWNFTSVGDDFVAGELVNMEFGKPTFGGSGQYDEFGSLIGG